jgi:branched-chain amino acid transport system substrate-binding protein
MTKNIRMILALVSLVVTMTVLPIATGCAPGVGPGSDGTGSLKIGITTPSTGPAAEKGSPMGHANLDAIKYINEELGGVGGHQIEVVWLDNAYDAAKVVTNVKRFMDEGCLMFATASSKMMTASMEIANRDEFPGLVAFSSPEITHPPRHIYGQTPDYGDDWAAFANFYLDNIWQGTGKPKMALHLLNNPTGSGALNASKALADEMGIEIVAVEEHTTNTISEMESLTRVMAQEPDVLFISSTPAPTAVIIGNAVDLGMYPGVTIGCAHASFTKALIDIAGADVVEGVYGTAPTVLWGEDVPGMAKATEYVRNLHPDDEGNTDYIISWAQSLIMAEILRVALDNVGYDVLAQGDVESWRAIETEGIQKLSNYDVEGLHGPVGYTAGDNRLDKSNRIYQVIDGELANPSPWIEAPLINYEDYDWFGQ